MSGRNVITTVPSRWSMGSTASGRGDGSHELLKSRCHCKLHIVGRFNGMAVAPCKEARTRRRVMLHYALMFLIVGLIAGALGLIGVAQVASQIAWVLFLIGIIFVVIHIVSGRRASLP